MKISELIKELELTILRHGDLPVYTNGEHGINECEEVTKGHICCNRADLLFDTDMTTASDQDLICHIGGD